MPRLRPMPPKPPRLWADLTEAERTAAVRRLMPTGMSRAAMGRELGTTKNAIISWAYRFNITEANAAVWTPALIIPRKHSQTPPRPHRRKTLAQKRSRLKNKAVDLSTRWIVDQVNRMPVNDIYIEIEADISIGGLSQVRNDYWRPSEFMRQVLQSTINRFAARGQGPVDRVTIAR